MSIHETRPYQSALVTWQVPVTTTPASLCPAWAATTAYTIGRVVTNGGNLYQCRTAGTSAGSGGPTGAAADITDGTAHWRFIKVGTAFKGGARIRNLAGSASPIFYGDSNMTATGGVEVALAASSDEIKAPTLASVYVCTAASTATLSVAAYV